MASTSIQTPSSSSSVSASIPRWKYDVFLSFRGEDTRKNFTDHLFAALIERGIRTFRDDEEIELGSEIAPKIMKAIEESRFCVVVFSKRYAHSRWCLDELVKIIECVKENGQTIIPIFYHVDPSNVRKQTGSFEKAFVNLEKQNEEKAKTWRNALRKAGNISGWHLKHEHESVFIKRFANEIRRRSNCKILSVGENIVGMDFHLDKIKSLINNKSNEVRMIGIYGIGGIGKTTIAKAICNSISYKFDGWSFLENVREIGNCCGLLQLQQNLLNDILNGRNIYKYHNVDEGVSVIKDRLHSKKVLIVVDNVDDLSQLECIVGKHDWFCRGSIIIITSRNKHLLTFHGVDEAYEVKELNYEESIELLSRYAFKQSLPKDGYKNILDCAIDYAKGLPLALKFLGIFLFSKTIPEWESSLRKLRRKLPMEIESVLKISFDGLDDMEKDIFLDIACFFKGKDKDFVSRILDGCNFYAESGIRILVDKCLLTVSNNKLDMHDLLQHMGWEIVREQCLKEPGERSRLWEGEDISHVLTRNTGTKAIEGIILDMSTSKQIRFTTRAFKQMRRLRLLEVRHDVEYDSMMKFCKDKRIPREHLPRDFTFPSDDLRYLHWDGYPLKCLPSNFHGENLVELSLQSSSIEVLWDKKVFQKLKTFLREGRKALCDNKVFKKLKVLNASYSQHLIKIPDFSSVPNLEILIVKGCKKLRNLPGDIYKLKHLKTLCCTGCSNLESFPEIMDVMENLRELYLDGTGINNLPSSTVHLTGIEYLDLAHCESLESLPESICNLRSLQTLLVHNCPKLDKFPSVLSSVYRRFRPKVRCAIVGHGFSHPSSLKPEFLEIRSKEPKTPQLGNLEPEFPQHGSPQSDIPEPGSPQSENPRPEGSSKSYCEDQKDANLSDSCILYGLEELDLSYCNLAQGITRQVCNLPSLQLLNLSGNNFNKIPPNISNLCKLRILKMSHCKWLLEIPELPSSLREIDVHGCPSLLPLQSHTKLLQSLLDCFKSDIQDLERGFGSSDIFIRGSLYDGKGISLLIDGSSGVPDWITHQNMGNEVIMQLPLNWHENNDLLGFSLFSLFHINPVNGFEEKAEGGEVDPRPCSLKCELSFLDEQFGIVDDLFLDSFCGCYNEGGVSDQVWVTYYPKVGVKEMYHSNNYRLLKASFRGTHVKMEKCGIDLVYTKDDGLNNPTTLMHGLS